MKLKRALSIQDISCFGRCSLTAALPIMSAMGIETAIIPTAVLSTHTGGFEGYTFHNLTEDIMPIVHHWQKYSIAFDAICTGYLGSAEQIDIMKEIFKIYSQNGAMIFADPAMGDYGKLYSGFDSSFADKMVSLCAVADVITPNITEASMITGMEYAENGYGKDYIDTLLKKLAETGAKKIILTGVSYSPDEQGVAFFDREQNEYGCYMTENLPGGNHGTGDIFAAVAAGVLIKGGSLYDACKTAADFVVRSIRATVDDNDKYWYGVNFESQLSWLMNKKSNRDTSR